MNWDRVERLLGIEALAHLRQKKVAIIGLGSGGGFVATGLAMSGVGNFVLIDSDELEQHNVVRHVADMRDVGRPKVEIAANLIRQRSPDVSITSVKGKIEQHAHLLDAVDLVISAVDGEGTKYMINDLCLERQLPAIYAGVYERGEGGDVVILEPRNGPCYACWASNLREGHLSPSPDGSGELDYGLLNERGTLDAEPGLWLHVVRVAAAQADLALNRLLYGEKSCRQMPANTLIMANNALEIIEGKITPPHSAEWINIARDPHCMICSRYYQHDNADLSLDVLGGNLVTFEGDEDE